MTAILLVLAAVLCGRPLRAEGLPAADPDGDSVMPGPLPPVVFDGLGLASFEGGGSIGSALHGVASDSADQEMPLDLLVRGPSGRGDAADPLAAELKSRIEGVDISAGLRADRTVIEEGPATWVGGVGVSSDHDLGREVLELKTSLARGREAGILGVEVGPRIERRLRHGTVFFLDGKAQAQARRSSETGGWMLPRLTEPGQDSTGMVGVAASTGLVR